MVSLFGISGWSVVLFFILLSLVLTWRLIAYASRSADSPYVQAMAHEAHETHQPGDEVDEIELPVSEEE